MNPEQQCIDFALHYRQQLLEEEIREIRLWSRVEWPSFKKGWIEWNPTIKGRMAQVLMIPFVLFIVGLMEALLSLMSVFEQWQRKRRLRKDVKQLAASQAPYPVPADKTLDCLWHKHGLHKNWGFECQIVVLERWIKILYGGDTLGGQGLNERADAINARHIAANSAWHQGEEGAAHFHFLPVADILVRELAGELPEYQTFNR